MQTLYGYPPPHPSGYGFDEGWDFCDDDDLLMSFHPHDAAHSPGHLSSSSQSLQPVQQAQALDSAVLACGCVPFTESVTSRSAAAGAAAGPAAASAAVSEGAAGLATASGLGPVPSAAEAADATRLLRESLAIVQQQQQQQQQQQHGLDPAHDQAYLRTEAERVLAAGASPSLEHQAGSEAAAAAAARQQHRDLVAAARANAVGNRRRAVVSQALHLFATDANVQGAVASLVCDEAVWRAVNSNPHVQQLLQSSGNSSRRRRPPRHDAEGGNAAAAASAGASGTAANTNAGQHELLSSASLRQRQTIQALPAPPPQSAAAGNTAHGRSHVMARGHNGSSVQQMDALLQSVAAMVHTLSDHIATWMSSLGGLLGRLFGVSSAKGGGGVHGSGAVAGEEEEEEANHTLSYVMVVAVMVIGIIVLKRPLYI